MDYQMPNYAGFTYMGQPMNAQPIQKQSNALTAEEIEHLQKKVSQFTVTLTQDEMLRGICTHRSPDGMSDTLIDDPVTGGLMCKTCGYHFKPIDPNTSIDEIRDNVQSVVNILQTVKLLYIDFPTDASREFFPLIGLLDKVPQLFEYAVKNFSKHENTGWRYNNNPSTYNMFQNLMNMFGGGMMGQQPMMNPGMSYQQQPMGQPMMNQGMNYQQPMGQQPMMNQGMNFGYQTPMSNGFGYPGASQQQPMMQGYQPAQGGFNYTPPTTTEPAQPTVANSTPPVAPKDVKEDTVTTTVNA